MTAHHSKHDSGGLVAIGQGVYFSKPIKKTGLDAEKKDSSSISSVQVNPNLHVEYLLGISSFIVRVAHPKPPLFLVGAKLLHVLKYTKFYNELYPEAAKIVARSEASFFWSTTWAKKPSSCLPPATNPSKKVQDACIEPIVAYPTPRVLVHTFSDGGARQLTTLSSMLASRPTFAYYTTTLSPSPTSSLRSALILDSCPGNGGVNKTIRAFTSVAGANPILRRLVVLFVRGLYWYMTLHKRITFLLSFLSRSPSRKLKESTSGIESMKTHLLTPHLLPWFSPSTTKRLYIYSTADDIIPAEEVEAHAKRARKVGVDVRTEDEGSPHVAHARTYPELYGVAGG
ncbi:hypothetical protein BDZ97DRAFT_1766358 [Flammula alnicola]|nr:hypothetical protein BDZ97DRAFT_1766358 [Flammula alnicola]